jgi:hypothetical protein
MEADEYRKWMGFYLLEPFGDEWRQTAKLCQIVANTQGNKTKENEFMPTEMSREQSAEEMEQVLMAAMAGLDNG